MKNFNWEAIRIVIGATVAFGGLCYIAFGTGDTRPDSVKRDDLRTQLRKQQEWCHVGTRTGSRGGKYHMTAGGHRNYKPCFTCGCMGPNSAGERKLRDLAQKVYRLDHKS